MQYDPFQKQAIEYINQGHSVLVSAPTGAGKTLIAEHIIREAIRKGEKVIYTAPIKALSNQKFREFQEETEGHVGILTGDVTLNARASVLIMTTEIFRNKILENSEVLQDYAWIIFDEIHYLDDYERGSVWEESLIFLPAHMKFLGLSATIPNIDELAQWLENIHGRSVKVVRENKRPVPLHFFYQCQGEVYEEFSHLIKKGFRRVDSVHGHYGKWPQHISVKPNKPTTLIKYLYENDLLPCIYFAFSRKRTEYLAEEIQTMNFLNDQERVDIMAHFKNLCRRFDLTNEPSAQKLRPLIERGIGYHHAGMLPTLKEAVERLFTSRLLKVIFTTETFALGINMPARTVVFDELRKYYGRGFAALRTRDFFQMAGRAGRRSIDTQGHVFCRINPRYISAQELKGIVYGAPEKVASQFNTSYATILNLYQNYRERLYDIYPRSFHYFQVGKNLHKRAMDLMRTKVNILKEFGCIRKNRLTDKGIFAGKVYGYELILSQLYEEGILENLSVKELVVLTTAVVYEPRRGQQAPYLNRSAKNLERMTNKIMDDIHRLEKRAGIKDVSKRCYFHLTAAMEAWVNQGGFQETLEHTDTDEGEMVRYFRMSIQILREISEAPVSDSLKERIQQTIGLINRDVIDSEKQLRM